MSSVNAFGKKVDTYDPFSALKLVSITQNIGKSQILYKAYINLESNKNPKKFHDFVEEELATKIQLKPNPEKNKVIKTN